MRLSIVETKQYEVPATNPRAKYPQPFDDRTLARATGISLSALWYFVRHAHLLYTRHTIEKKSGGQRPLHVPDPRLARAQEKILRRMLNRVDYPEWVAAYVPGRSTLDAAEVHAGKRILVVIDIQDFFFSTKRSWVRDAFHEEMGLSGYVSQLLATLVTAPRVPGVKRNFIVPQGAPTSGAVANLVAMNRLDPNVREVCARYGMSYTRYADDLAFSRSTPMGDPEVESFIREILRAIRKSGYYYNGQKTRVQRQGRQQRLLGLTINERPNYPKKEYRRLRALVHRCATRGLAQVAAEQGYVSPEALESHLHGLLTYVSHVSPRRAEALWSRLEPQKPPAAAE